MSASKKFSKLFSVKELRNTANTYIKFNTASGIDKMNYDRFMEQKNDIIDIIHRKTIDGSYHFTPYKEKLIIKSKDSLPRVISIPTIRDKIVMKGLHFLLTEVFSVRQSLPQKYIQEIKDVIGSYDYFIKMDLSNFFGSLNHGILMSKLKSKIRKKEILSLIQKSIKTANNRYETNKVGVPQGLPISNVLAHIYIQELDEKFMNYKNMSYFRYVDDILILCSKKDASRIEKAVKYEIEATLGLVLNDSKEQKGNIEDGFDFLGYAIRKFSGKMGITVKESTLRRIENSIVKMFTEYKHSKVISSKQFLFKLNNKITGSISNKVEGDEAREYNYGWLFYYSQIDDTGILYHLDWFVRKMIDDFGFTIINKSEIKSFVKAYYEIRYNVDTSDYIHRPDLLTQDEKKKLLMDVFNINEYILTSDEKIDRLYYKFIYKPIKEYEKDIKKVIS